MSTTAIVGGAERSLLLLVRGLRQRNVDAQAAVLQDGPLRDQLSRLGVESAIIHVPEAFRHASRYNGSRSAFASAGLALIGMPAALALARLARRYGADIIHSNGMKAHTLAGVAGRLARVPVVWHARDFPPDGWAGRAFVGQARLLPSLIIANSDAVRSALAGSGASVVAIHNPVDLTAFHPGAERNHLRRELGIPADAPLIGMVAHLTPWKGHDFFMTVARQVAAAIPESRFVIAGGTVYETSGHRGYAEGLRALAASFGLSDRVMFLGARDDVPNVMADVDVLVHCPTSPEPFGRAIAEAMAAGRAVVAANAGGIPELIENDRSGILIEPGDCDGFTRAITRLVRDERLRYRLGNAARLRGEAMFAVDAHVSAVLEAYARVLPPERLQ